MNIIQLFFSAKGRIRRRTYWFAGIGLLIFSLIVKGGAHFLMGGKGTAFVEDLSGWTRLNPTPFNIFLWISMALVAWPSVCLSAKRWHDRNRPGWLAGVLLVASWGLAVAQVHYGPKVVGSYEGINWPVYGVSLFIALVLSVWQFVELGCLDGTRGPNKYGPSPKGIGAAVDVF